MLSIINRLRVAAASVMGAQQTPDAPASSTTNDFPEVILPTRGQSAPAETGRAPTAAPPPVVRSKTEAAAGRVDTLGLVLMRRFLRPKVGDPPLTAEEARALVIFVRTLPLRLIRLSPVPVSFYCQLCLEHQPLNEPHAKLPCDHHFCKRCLVEYATHKIESAEVVPLQCPHFDDGVDGDADPRCTFDVGEEHLVALGLPDALLAKYRRFVARQTIETHRECPQCEASNTRGPTALSNQLTCGQCGTKFCYVHGGAHPGLWCWQWEWQQRRARADEAARAAAAAEAATDATLARFTRRCPHRRCGAPTIKSSGCNHITCRQCKRHWCWRCGRTMSAGSGVSWHYNAANLAGCPGHMFSDDGAPSDLPSGSDDAVAAPAAEPPRGDYGDAAGGLAPVDIEAQVAAINARGYFRAPPPTPQWARAAWAACEWFIRALCTLLVALVVVPHVALCLVLTPVIPIVSAPIASIGWCVLPTAFTENCCAGTPCRTTCGPTNCCGYYACVMLMLGSLLWAPLGKLADVLDGSAGRAVP